MAMLFCATGCLHRHKAAAPSAHTTPTPAAPAPAAPAAPIVQGEEGIASWYGHPYHGRRAASGEIYNMYDMTAAHRTLPFGTQVRVHDLENGRDVTVRINDRGPFVEGRIIDLSYAAAQAMGMPGLARVRLEILGLGATSEPARLCRAGGRFSRPRQCRPPEGPDRGELWAGGDPEFRPRRRPLLSRARGPREFRGRGARIGGKASQREFGDGRLLSSG